MEALELWVGAHVRQADGGYGVVDAVRSVVDPQRMYNLTVEGAHTFFVGDGQWLVHNAGDCGRKLWQLTEEMTESKEVIGGRVYHLIKGTYGEWWTRDTAGHAESTFKVYKKGADGAFEWYRDVDKCGQFIDPSKKHKGEAGRRFRE